MAYKGPDISAWQGDIDIKTLATQVDFFIFLPVLFDYKK